MTDLHIAFECEQMPMVDAHGQQWPAADMLVRVAASAQTPDGTWVVFLDDHMREDDTQAIRAAAALMGCGQVTPIGEDHGDTPSTITVAFQYGMPRVSDPQPLTGRGDVTRYWRDLRNQRQVKAALRDNRR